MVALTVPLSGCGGGETAAPSPPPSPIDNPTRIVISAAGAVTPREITVVPGARVLFVNNHSRPHEMTSDPHPEHSDCPAINSVGLLAPGASRETGNLVAAQTCGFHDHANPDNASLRGRIIVR